MATLTVSQIVRAGLDPDTPMAAAANGGDAFANTGKEYLRVVNGHASVARQVTIASQLPAAAIPQGAASANTGGSVPAQEERLFGPFDPASFNDSNGRVVVTYDDESDLTVGAFKL